MSVDLVKQALAELGDVVRCRCSEAYTVCGRRDPDCQCDSAEAVKVVAERIGELETKLKALDHAYDSIVQALRFEALRTDDAESKLAKAVETISLCRKMQAQFAHTEDPLMVLLDTTIAELKGQNDE